MVTMYDRLVALLDQHGAAYRFIDHAPEGRTDLVSALREHDVRCAAKCLVLMLKEGKKLTKFALAVVPGDARLDMGAIRRIYAATYAGFASTPDAERLSGCVTGTVLPFSFDGALPVVVDPALFEAEEIHFNAARLDRSIAMKSEDYRRIAQPRVEKIT